MPKGKRHSSSLALSRLELVLERHDSIHRRRASVFRSHIAAWHTRCVKFCSSMQFFHRRSSVAYHTIIHLLFPFIQAPRAISHSKAFPSYNQSSQSYISSPQYRTIPIKYHAMTSHHAHNSTLYTSPNLLSSAILIFYPSHPSPVPYIPPAPAPLCKCPKYCLLVVFHAAMYFSMQLVKLVCSADEMDEPGLGIARSKQCSLTFCRERKWRVSL
jgi:hypothetical protein